jgi:hypothetical protein
MCSRRPELCRHAQVAGGCSGRNGEGRARQPRLLVQSLYHSVFYVRPSPNELELAALPLSNPAEITLAGVFAAKQHIRPGEVDIITALLKAGPIGATSLKSIFYNGDHGNVES